MSYIVEFPPLQINANVFQHFLGIIVETYINVLISYLR